MNRCCAVVAVVGLFLAAGQTALADEAAGARAVVEKGIKAMGPADALAKFKVEAWKARGKITMMGKTYPYTCDYLFQAPDRFRFVMDGEFEGQKMHMVAAGSDGKAWEQLNGATQDVTGDKLKEFNHEIYTMRVSMLTPLKDPAFKLAMLGDVKSIKGETQVGVKVSHEGNRDVTLFFDKTTGLLMRSMSRVVDEFSNKEVSQEVIFSDYQKKDGIMQFGRITILRDGKTFIEEELYDHKSLDKLDEGLFKKPA
jgi:hypothetical protein